MCLVFLLLCAAGSGWSGETILVYDNRKEGLLADNNTQFGVNLAIDKNAVSGLLVDLGIGSLGIADGAIALLLSPVNISLGGGAGELGGGGGGGISIIAPDSGSGLRNGMFYGGKGTELNIAGLGMISAGGGGGLTSGGLGYGLVGGGGGGGGLGITAGILGMGGTGTERVSQDTSFTVGDDTLLDIFGGSGAGGGLAGLNLGALGTSITNLVSALNGPFALGLLNLHLPSVDANKLLTPEEGIGAIVGSVSVNGTGTINVLGGVGGGGGLLLNSDGGRGTGSTVNYATIEDGTVNVFGGAGGGANALLILTTNGGEGGGGKILDGTMSGGILNIYSGANGGGIDSGLLGLNAGVANGIGGAGGGGHVIGLELTDGVMNLYKGTSAAAPDTEATYGGGAAKAESITNNGGIINLNGGILTGTYTQDGDGSILNLSGGTYDVTGGGTGGGGLFSGGTIKARGGSLRELKNAEFDGIVGTDAIGTGNSLLIKSADITAGGDLHIGTQVTLQAAENSAGTVTLESSGTLSVSYTQTGTGTLVLAGTTLTDGGGAGGTEVSISGGFVNSSQNGSTLDGVEFSNTVRANSSGTQNTLMISNADIQTSATLFLGKNVTLSDTIQTTGTVTLNTGSILGHDYLLKENGFLILGETGTYSGADAVFAGGTLQSDATGGTLDDGVFTGTVGTGVVNPGDTLIISNAQIGEDAQLTINTGVTLDNTAFAEGKVVLSTGGGLSGTYTQSGTGTLILSGGSTSGAESEFKGGFIDTLGGVPRILDDATFTGTVDVKASGGALEITDATIGEDANLKLDDNVTLKSGQLGEGEITLTGGKLATSYTQTGGTLNLDMIAFLDLLEGGMTNDFSGGVINTNTTSILNGAKITNTVTATASVAGKTLTITNADIGENGNLHLGSHDHVTGGDVILKDATHSKGTITLNTDGFLGGTSYTQTGGKLVLDGGEVAANTNVTLSGGTVQSNETLGELDVDHITGNVTLKANGGTTSLTVTGSTIDNSADLTIGENVNLKDTILTDGTVTLGTKGSISGSYNQDADGELILAGGGAAAGTEITLSGGIVQSNVADSELTVGTINGNVTLKTEGELSTLTVLESTIENAANLTVESGVTIKNTELVKGSITLGENSILSGSYKQGVDGTLILAGGTVNNDATLIISGGTIQSNVADAKFNNAIFSGVTTLTTSGADSTLTLTGTIIKDGIELEIADDQENKVFMENTTIVGGELTTGGEGLKGIYTQQGGKLTLEGGSTENLTQATFDGGEIISLEEDSTLTTARFTDQVTFNMEEGKLLIKQAVVTDKGDITVDTGLTLKSVTLDPEGTITIKDGTITDSYKQTGGKLFLEQNGMEGAEITLSGGLVTSRMIGADLGTATVDGMVDFEADENMSMDITGIKILGDKANVGLGKNVTLDDHTLTEGTITLKGGTLGGKYEQSGTGTLALTGGTTEAGNAMFSGGKIDSVLGDSVLNNATFNYTVNTISSDSTGTLKITNAKIDQGGFLEIGKRVTLDAATLNDGAGITLKSDGSLSGEYIQYGGTLTLAGGSAAEAEVKLSGGNVLATAKGSTLDKITVNNTVETSSSGVGTLTITKDSIHEKANLIIGNNVFLQNAELADGEGTITLKTGGNLSGTYTQTGGVLALAGGGTGGADKVELSGGRVEGIIPDAELANATFTGAITVSGSEKGGTLNIRGATIDDDKAVLTLDAGATLIASTLAKGEIFLETNSSLGESYTQTGGSLYLNGGNANSASGTFSGGFIISQKTGSILNNATFTDEVNVEASDADLLLTNAQVAKHGNLDMKAGVTLQAGRLTEGTITLRTMSKLDISYTQTGGTLILDGGGTDNSANRFSGGGIVSMADDAVLHNATFTERVGIDAADAALSLEGAFVTGNGELDLKDNVTLKNGTLEQGKITLHKNSTLAENYTQRGGALYLADGSSENAKGEFSGGEIISVAEASRLNNARIIGENAVHASGESNAGLIMSAARIDGGHLVAGRNTEITGASVTNSGTLSIQTNAVLTGTTTMESLGGITFSNPAPGNSATIENLSGDGGVLHFTVNMGTGETDFYIVEESEGNHLLSVAATGELPEDPIDLVRDVSDGAGYSLAEEYSESGANLMQDNLTSRVDGDGSRTWSLSRKVAGLTHTAEGVGNAPAISLLQATVAMSELGRHFRDLRDANRAAGNTDSGIWARSYVHHMTVSAFGEASMNMHGLDIGFDQRFDGFLGGSLYTGVVAGGQWVGNLAMEQSYGSDGSGGGKSFSAGAYALWMNSGGWYADAAARHVWSDLDLTSYDTANSAVKYNPRRTGLAVSMEVGRQIPFGMYGGWYAEPSLGLTGAWMHSDSFSTSRSDAFSYGATKSLQGTIGVALGHNGTRMSPYFETALVHVLNGKTAVRYHGSRLRTDPSGSRLRLTLGASFKLTDNLSLSADAGYEYGRTHRDINGNLGINVTW